MIEIKNVSKSYKKGKKIIDNINLKINDGEIFGFIGPNGAGKTTTIKIINNNESCSDGDIKLDGISILEYPELIREHRVYTPVFFP